MPFEGMVPGGLIVDVAVLDGLSAMSALSFPLCPTPNPNTLMLQCFHKFHIGRAAYMGFVVTLAQASETKSEVAAPMMAEPKFFTVHGEGTHYDLMAWKFSGRTSPVLDHAGYGDDTEYLAIIRLGPTAKLFVDTKFGYAPSATGDECPILNTAVSTILKTFDVLPATAHIEVNVPGYPGPIMGKAKVTEGAQFR